jgi:putative flavoprotein involved in K+ transport
MGVEPVGRWAALRDGRALFSGGLRNVCSLADLKMERLLDVFDEWAPDRREDPDVVRSERFAPTEVPASPRLELDLRSGEIRSIVWATGFRPDYRWLDVPVVDAKGQLRHDGGARRQPGPLRPRPARAATAQVHFIHGIEDDAREVIDHLSVSRQYQSPRRVTPVRVEMNCKPDSAAHSS